MVASSRCKVCNLAPEVRDQVHLMVRGDPGDPQATPPRPAVPKLASHKVCAWLHQEHGVELRFTSLNEHLREHVGEHRAPSGRGTSASAGAGRGKAPGSKPPRRERERPPKPLAPVKAKESAAVADVGSSAVAAQAPPPLNPEIAVLDFVIDQGVEALSVVNQHMAQRLTQVPAEVTDTPVQETKKKRWANPLVGPTKAEADMIPATITAVTGAIKLRAFLLSGGKIGAGAGGEDGMAAGLKDLYAGLGKPPVLVEGDDPDPESDEEIRGYEAASPTAATPAPAGEGEGEPPAIKTAAEPPPPPPSGPRAPAPKGAEPGPGEARLAKAAGGWAGGGWGPNHAGS